MIAFEPQGLFSRPHVQTLTVAWPQGSAPRSFLRQGRPLVRPVEGGALSGVMYWQPDPNQSASVVVLVHGLGGSSQASYVTTTAHALWRRGYHVLALDQRGAGQSVRTAPYLYNAGLTSDLDEVVRAFGDVPGVDGVHVVGFSIGGNVVLKLAAEWADAAPSVVRSVTSMAAPVDLAAASRNLARWQAGVYRAHVLRGLITQALTFRRARPQLAKYEALKVARVTQIADYDAQVIVPHYGFGSVEAYYEQASAGPLLGAIQVPTLALHAQDDPMVPGATVEQQLRAASSAVQVEMTAHGGHLGWAEGTSTAEFAERWSTRVLLEHLAKHRD